MKNGISLVHYAAASKIFKPFRKIEEPWFCVIEDGNRPSGKFCILKLHEAEPWTFHEGHLGTQGAMQTVPNTNRAKSTALVLNTTSCWNGLDVTQLDWHTFLNTDHQRRESSGAFVMGGPNAEEYSGSSCMAGSTKSRITCSNSKNKNKQGIKLSTQKRCGAHKSTLREAKPLHRQVL